MQPPTTTHQCPTTQTHGISKYSQVAHLDGCIALLGKVNEIFHGLEIIDVDPGDADRFSCFQTLLETASKAYSMHLTKFVGVAQPMQVDYAEVTQLYNSTIKALDGPAKWCWYPCDPEGHATGKFDVFKHPVFTPEAIDEIRKVLTDDFSQRQKKHGPTNRTLFRELCQEARLGQLCHR